MVKWLILMGQVTHFWWVKWLILRDFGEKEGPEPINTESMCKHPRIRSG